MSEHGERITQYGVLSVNASTTAACCIITPSANSRVRLHAISFNGLTSTANQAAFVGDTTTARWFFANMATVTSNFSLAFGNPLPLQIGATFSAGLMTAGGVNITVAYDIETIG